MLFFQKTKKVFTSAYSEMYCSSRHHSYKTSLVGFHLHSKKHLDHSSYHPHSSPHNDPHSYRYIRPCRFFSHSPWALCPLAFSAAICGTWSTICSIYPGKWPVASHSPPLYGIETLGFVGFLQDLFHCLYMSPHCVLCRALIDCTL
mgnify:CR=1 FL=1